MHIHSWYFSKKVRNLFSANMHHILEVCLFPLFSGAFIPWHPLQSSFKNSEQLLLYELLENSTFHLLILLWILLKLQTDITSLKTPVAIFIFGVRILYSSVEDSYPDPNPQYRNVFGPSGSGTFHHQAKIVRKTLIPTVL